MRTAEGLHVHVLSHQQSFNYSSTPRQLPYLVSSSPRLCSPAATRWSS